MGPPENLTDHPENQAGRRKRSARRPRARCCLLKGCNQSFHPRQSNQRYCSAECRKAARKWSRWKAQQRYRATKSGKAKRNGQSGRYRERVRSRKLPEPEAVDEVARVVTTEHFFNQFRDRPGCYEGFTRQRRSPMQHYCSQACRHAMDRVRKRERRWKRARI